MVSLPFQKRLTKKIKSLKLGINHLNPVMKQTDVINFLETQFSVLPIDKAPNNVAVICKRYYMEVILNEIGVIRHVNSAYCKAN